MSRRHTKVSKSIELFGEEMIPIIGQILGIAEKFIPDTNKLAELEAELSSKMEDSLQKAVDADKEIRLAEMSRGGVAALWRPIAALSLTFIALCQLLVKLFLPLYAYYKENEQLWVALESIEALPDYFWIAYISFISVYAAGRSFEKGRIPLLKLLGK